MMRIQLLKGNDEIRTESMTCFLRRVTSDWELARKNLQRSIGLQQKYYNRKCRCIHYKVEDFVIFSPKNLKMKGVSRKLQKRFVVPFEIIEKIEQQAYRLSLPESWKIHTVFHMSLLKDWTIASLQQDHQVPADDKPEVEDHTMKRRKFCGGRRLNEARDFERIFSRMEGVSN